MRHPTKAPRVNGITHVPNGLAWAYPGAVHAPPQTTAIANTGGLNDGHGPYSPHRGFDNQEPKCCRTAEARL
jgi:hypothetical protein